MAEGLQTVNRLFMRLSGGRTWWAHVEFTRINIEPTILRKTIEELCVLGAFRVDPREWSLCRSREASHVGGPPSDFNVDGAVLDCYRITSHRLRRGRLQNRSRSYIKFAPVTQTGHGRSGEPTFRE